MALLKIAGFLYDNHIPFELILDFSKHQIKLLIVFWSIGKCWTKGQMFKKFKILKEDKLIGRQVMVF